MRTLLPSRGWIIGLLALAGCFSDSGPGSSDGNETSGSDTASTSGGDTNDSDTEGTTGSDTGSGGIDPDCDPTERPSDDGIYVRPVGGNDEVGNGTAVSPFATVGRALQAATDTGKTNIYLDVGTYAENVMFTPDHAGIVVEGRWTVVGVDWSRDCRTDAREKTVIVGPDPTLATMHFSAGSDMIGISGLTIATQPQAPEARVGMAGPSMIATRIQGDGSHVRFEDVVIRSGHAAGGGDAAIADDGGVASCDGLDDCSNAATGDAGTPGAAASTGTFTPDGYRPGNGSRGMDGQAGANGTPGQTGSCYDQCFDGCHFHAAGDCHMHVTTTCGDPGTCGCGGLGGNGGFGGRGGGASVAILVLGESTVELIGSRVRAGDGGDGSPGGDAGNGGEGSLGAQGDAGSCGTNESCVWEDEMCKPNNNGSQHPSGGAAGSKGGNGGYGGPGGGGAGGPSYALVSSATATSHLTDTALAFGEPGAGAGDAPDGTAGGHLELP